MASTIGYFRFESGKHFPTDIITGAVVGGGIGFIIPYLHRTSKKNLSLIPASTGRTLQLGVYFQF
jgi:membrane-associated phospholipid phosphatase